MPIIRRDETTDPLDPYILVLWDKKWLIIGVGLATTILVYLVLLFVPSVYNVKSEIFVNRLTTVADGQTPNPESVVTLLKSQPVIEKVRDEFAQKFDIEPPPIERFIKQFKVESEILQDTSVRKEVSPVIQLEVETKGADETSYIMNRWIHNFINEFGNYTAQEAVMKREAFQVEKDRLDKEIAEVERKQAELDTQLPYLRKILAEKLDLLSPSRLNLHEDEDGSNNIKLDLSLRNARMNPGLLERYANTELLLKTDNPTTAGVELQVLLAAINDARTSITEAQAALANVIFQQRNTTRHLQLLQSNQTAVNDALGRFVVASAVYKNVADTELPAGGDIRALSMPVTPDVRVWPKRTTSAALTGIAAAILTMFAVLARNFLTRLSPRATQ